MKPFRVYGPIAVAATGLLALVSWALAQNPGDALEQGFKNPPDSAKPRTWWHWTNGNITKEGIGKDLEWMKRVGIGGMQLADVASGSGQTVEKKILLGSPDSAHQPLDTKPGNTMVGTHINRNITWAEQARPFMTYLARNSFMLQQGLFVADLAYLLPEGAPATMPIWGQGLQPPPPEGYGYDYVNADVVLHQMSVKEDGRVALPDGMSYRVLVLPPIERMTLPVLRKIRDLVAGGATVLGPKPNTVHLSTLIYLA